MMIFTKLEKNMMIFKLLNLYTYYVFNCNINDELEQLLHI